MELIDWGSPENAAEADTGDRDEAIAIARATVNELTNSGEMVIRGAARVVDRLTGVPTEPGFVVNGHLAVAAADSPGAGSGKPGIEITAVAGERSDTPTCGSTVRRMAVSVVGQCDSIRAGLPRMAGNSRVSAAHHA